PPVEADGRDTMSAGDDTVGDGAAIGRVLVIVPTYNERENLPRIIARLRAAVPAADVLVADDASPDGTGDIADDLARADEHVHVVHRKGKEGLGAAYLHGFARGRGHGCAL